MRPKGSPELREALRRLDVARVREGWEVAEVAAFVGAEPRFVRRWAAAHARDGDAGLAAAPVPGRPARLTAAQEARVLGWLDQAPSDFGFVTRRWTAPRLAAAIERELGVRFDHR